MVSDVLVHTGVAGCMAVLLAGCGDTSGVHEIAGPTMGARYSVKIAGELDTAARERARHAIEAELALVDRLMSTWRDESEVSRFNREGPQVPFRVSPETLEVLEIARRVGALTGGAFDVTVGPVVRAWGFGPGGVVPAGPAPDVLARALALTGPDRLVIDVVHGTVTKTLPEVELDLSGIAPGYAADRIARALLGLGHADLLVDVAGEIVAHGRRPEGEPWRVGVAWPAGVPSASTADAPHVAAVALEGRGLATSGDYRNVLVDDRGVRRSHLIDPRTGRPVEHALTSVTVVHASAAEADALATALMVLGPDEGLALAERERLAAYSLVRQGDGRVIARETREFAALRTE